MERVIGAVLAAGVLLAGCGSAPPGSGGAAVASSGSAGAATSSADAPGVSDAPQDKEDAFIADLMEAETLKDMRALWEQAEKNSPAFTYLYSTGMMFSPGADQGNLAGTERQEFADVKVNSRGEITDFSRAGIPVSQTVQASGSAGIALYPSVGSKVKDGQVRFWPIAYRYLDGALQVVGSVENRTADDAWVTGETYQEAGGAALTDGMSMQPVPAGETMWFAYAIPGAQGTGGKLTAEVTIGGQISADDRVVLDVPAFR